MSYKELVEPIVKLIKADTRKTFLDTYKLEKVYKDYVSVGGCSVRTLKDALSVMFKSSGFYLSDEILTKITYILLDSN